MSPNNPHHSRCLEYLKQSSFFDILNTEAIHDVLLSMTMEVWKKSTFKNSIDCQSLIHFIMDGRLKVYQINPQSGKEYTIFILSKGDVFDVMNLLDDEEHDMYWEAMDELELLTIPVNVLKEDLQKYPAMNINIMHYLGKRMRLLENEATDISLHNTIIRLSNLLLKYFNNDTHQLEIINNLPNEEIASLIGSTRAVVNRHIQELKKCGAITVKRKQIDVQNLEMLLSISEERFIP